ncbi:MAG: orotidine-5'-phosphate decarboxylase [Planctomycetaceae bacterium]
MTSYTRRLHAAVLEKKTPALVGLDPRFDQLPDDVVAAARRRGWTESETVAVAFEEFCCRIIDVVAPLVPAVKPQAAFFEEYGPAGCLALQRVNHHARKAGLIVICDAKRGDIGSTAEAYARGYIAGEDPHAAAWGADALTINPYLGRDTLEPFLKVAHERGGGVYVLVRTSNPGAGSFQDRVTDGVPHYRYVAHVVEELSASLRGDDDYGCVGAVVGATYPAELVELRKAMPHVPLLIPGYGSQGGTAADVAAAFDRRGLGGLVNNSRGINFAFRQEPYRSQFSPEDWESAVAAATRHMIADLQQHIRIEG